MISIRFGHFKHCALRLKILRVEIVLHILMVGEPFMQNEQYQSKIQKSNERSLALIKAGMDIVVAVGLLQLAPKKVTPRVTGAFGFVSSLISCYQVCINVRQVLHASSFYHVCFLRKSLSRDD